MKSPLVEYGFSAVPDIEANGHGLPPLRTKPFPEIIDAASFIYRELAEPPELIAGLLHKGCKLALGGSSKAFKTWTLIDLGLSVAHGVPWLNFRTNAAPVLYVNFELQDWIIRRRIANIAKSKDIPLEPKKFFILNLRGLAADYHSVLPRIQGAMQSEFGLCIIDPLYKLYGLTDENKAGDVANLLNAIEEFAVNTGVAIAFGSHFSKGNPAQRESLDRISGSGVFARDVDSLLTFTKHEIEGCFTVEPTLRAFEAVSPFVVRWQFPLMQREKCLDPAKLKRAVGRKRGYNPKKLLTAIADTSEQRPISIAAWARSAQIPRQTLTDYVAEMRANGWIKLTGEGKSARQYITCQGKAFLTQS